jgi:hypothetical protein
MGDRALDNAGPFPESGITIPGEGKGTCGMLFFLLFTRDFSFDRPSSDPDVSGGKRDLLSANY